MADDGSRSGKRYASAEVLAYTEGVHAAHDPHLARAFQTPADHDLPAIMIGPSEGRFLEMLLRLVQAERVVEIGTLAGYSAIWLARALPATGRLWTLEANPRHAAMARENVAAAGLAGRIDIIEGQALERLPELTSAGPFDAVFIDADKEHYDLYAEWALEALRPGGLLIGDNAYFFGNLLADSPGARAVRRFHELVSSRCMSVCVPTPDGLVVGVKHPS